MTLFRRLLSLAPPLALLAVIALVLGTRLLGPHDLYEKDQPKTMAYTADIVRNGRYALPRDVIYQPATKPPLYNWIDAVAVKLTGLWSEPILKLPSLLGALATGAIVFAMSKPLGGLSDQTTLETARDNSTFYPIVTGCLAATIWFTFGSDVRHGSVIRLAYLARPDMLQCAFLTGAWACATIAVLRPTVRDALAPAIGFWLCITAAALTKGPAAAMPLVFAIAFALLTPNDRGRWRNLLKLWPAVGLPILIFGGGGWLFFAYRQDPQHVKSVIFGAEIAGRIIDKSPEGFDKPIWYSAMWFVTKTLPWGGIAVLCLLATWIIPSLRRRLLPIWLYLIVVLLCLSLPKGKRMDYLLPAYAPAASLIAIVAAAAIAQLPRPAEVMQPAIMLVPLYLAFSQSHRFRTQFHESIERWSDHAVSFVAAVRKQADPSQHRILVLVRGKHPITTLLGENPGSYLTHADLAAAEYVVAPLQDGWTPLVESDPVPVGFETLENRQLDRLGLYHFAPGTAPVDRLVELQKQVGTWTADENPYHEPGTVYRD